MYDIVKSWSNKKTYLLLISTQNWKIIFTVDGMMFDFIEFLEKAKRYSLSYRLAEAPVALYIIQVNL